MGQIMLLMLVVAALMVEGSFAGHTFIVESGCDPAFLARDAHYTLCLVDIGTDAPLSAADKQAIVDTHNTYRANVSPTATNMVKLVWDDELAVYAGKWARQCYISHDSYSARSVPSMPGVSIGQNIAAGYKSVMKGVDGWHSEVDFFEHGVGPTEPGKVVGHYTQVVGYRAIRIGCGEAICPNKYGRYQVCNYAMGQMSSDIKTPFEKGASCSKCPVGKCSDNLCDCGGKLCLNGGSLDTSTCSCTCMGTWTGDTCSKDCKGMTCLNGGTLDGNTCSCTCPDTWEGDTCSKKKCKVDVSRCDSVPLAHCDLSPIVRLYCPRKCGLC
ncbi:cysteine-rich venom protein ENH2-like [Haliotis cracherodii]|uniref:cysteine-rich venom protein ENH2-like n=1 Tax=Haliotis cracherodii TaxID=6455 RepID=UPI0039EA0903